MDSSFSLKDLALRRGALLSRQIAAALRSAVREGQIAPGGRVPSVRQIASELAVSRTTAEAALRELVAGGWIEARRRSGYFAAHLPAAPAIVKSPADGRVPVKWNFSDSAVDPDEFPEVQWRRCLSRAAKKRRILASYGDPQGELPLRQALSQYCAASRDVAADPGRILVGAGLSTLLAVHASLLASIRHVHFAGQAYRQVEPDYAERGWTVTRGPLADLKAMRGTLVLAGPTDGAGHVVGPGQRRRLLAWAAANAGHIIEDDYLGEFRPPEAARGTLQSLSPDGPVTYFGSFSRTLLPSTRVSFMVLPAPLAERWQAMRGRWLQTAGTIEQLALADFIACGALRRHVRRLRLAYEAKSALLRSTLGREAPLEGLRIVAGLGPQQTRLRIPGLDAAAFCRRAAGAGIALHPDELEPDTLVLSVAAIPGEAIGKACEALCAALRRAGS